MQAQVHTMAVNSRRADTSDVALCRRVLKHRTRYYLAQRDAGVSALGAAILDLIVLGQIEGCCKRLGTLSEVLNLHRSTVRLHVVGLIKDGWVDVDNSVGEPLLNMSEKAANYASNWIQLSLDG